MGELERKLKEASSDGSEYLEGKSGFGLQEVRRAMRSVSLLFGALLAFACGALRQTTLRPSNCRISSVEVTILNHENDDFIKTVRKYDKTITYARVREYAVNRWGEVLGKAGLYDPSGAGGTVHMKMRLSTGNWWTAEVYEGVVVPAGPTLSRGVWIESETIIQWGRDTRPLRARWKDGWVICTGYQWLALTKSVDMHTGLVLVNMVKWGMPWQELLPLFVTLLPCQETVSTYPDFLNQSNNLIKVLQRLAPRCGLEPALVALKDKDSVVRKAAAVALGKIGDRRAVESLIQALKDQDPSVRWEAAETLNKITGKDFGNDYDRWMR